MAVQRRTRGARFGGDGIQRHVQSVLEKQLTRGLQNARASFHRPPALIDHQLSPYCLRLFSRIIPCCTSRKNSGTKSNVSSVPESMPPITAVPISCWLAAPAPAESTRGITPTTNASEVIIIGRKRSRAPSSAASVRLFPC